MSRALATAAVLLALCVGCAATLRQAERADLAVTLSTGVRGWSDAEADSAEMADSAATNGGGGASLARHSAGAPVATREASSAAPADSSREVMPNAGYRPNDSHSGVPVAPGGAHPLNAQAATLTFTMPALNVKGDTLTGYLRYDVATLVQSRTWQDSAAAMKADSLAWARLWPTVAAEMAPRVVLSGYALAGAAVTVGQPPVSPLEGQAWYVIRACRDVCGYWSRAVAKSN